MASVATRQDIEQSISESRQTISQYELRIATAKQRLSEDPTSMKRKLAVWYLEADILETKKWLVRLEQERG